MAVASSCQSGSASVPSVPTENLPKPAATRREMRASTNHAPPSPAHLRSTTGGRSVKKIFLATSALALSTRFVTNASSRSADHAPGLSAGTANVSSSITTSRTRSSMRSETSTAPPLMYSGRGPLVGRALFGFSTVDCTTSGCQSTTTRCDATSWCPAFSRCARSAPDRTFTPRPLPLISTAPLRRRYSPIFGPWKRPWRRSNARPGPPSS